LAIDFTKNPRTRAAAKFPQVHHRFLLLDDAEEWLGCVKPNAIGSRGTDSPAVRGQTGGLPAWPPRFVAKLLGGWAKELFDWAMVIPDADDGAFEDWAEDMSG